MCVCLVYIIRDRLLDCLSDVGPTSVFFWRGAMIKLGGRDAQADLAGGGISGKWKRVVRSRLCCCFRNVSLTAASACVQGTL